MYESIKTFLIVILAMVAAFYIAVPFAAERIIISRMHSAGFEEPAVNVISITHKALRLSHVSAQNPELAIDFITITYNLSDLVQGKIDDIFISGLKYRIGFTDNTIDSGFPVSEKDPGDPFVLPFKTINVNAASLIINHAGQNYTVPFTLDITRVGSSILTFSSKPFVFGLPVNIEGQTDINTLETTIDAEASLSGQTSDPCEARVKFRWTIDEDGAGQGIIDIAAAAQNVKAALGGHIAGFQKAHLHVNAIIDHQMQFKGFETDFQAAGLLYNDFYAPHIRLNVSENASRFEFSAAADKPVDARIKISGTGKAGFSSPEPGGQNRWHIDLDMQEMEADLAALSIPKYFMEGAGLIFSGSGTLSAGPELTLLEIREKSILEADRVIYSPPGTRYQLNGFGFSPVIELRRTGDGTVRLSGSGRTTRQFDVNSNAVNISGGFFSLEADLEQRFGEALQGVVRTRSDISRIHIPAADTLISDAAIDIPVSLGETAAQKGVFSTGPITWNKTNWPGVKGQTTINDNRARLSGAWSFLPGAVLDFSFDMETDANKGLSGKATARTGWFELPEKEILTGLAPGLEKINITGSVNAAVNIDIKGAVLEPDLQVGLRDVSLAYPDMDMEITGARGKVAINSFSPLTTPGNQRIDVSGLKIGKISLVNGFAAFRLESADSVFLEKTRWHLPDGGFIAAHSSRVGLKDASADLEFFFEAIDIFRIIARVTEDKIDGSGQVYGRVPVLYDQGRLIIGDGFLYSVPGTGRLGIKDEAWLETLLLHIRDAMQGHPYLATVSERLEQALQDFEYNYLAVNLKKGAEDTSARIELRGRGVEGDPPQEVGSLVINVNDLGEIINRALRFQRTREESIERAFDELFDF